MATDAEFIAHVERLWDLAQKGGKDPVEALVRRGLFATPTVRRAISVAALEDAWHRLDGQTTADIMTVFTGQAAGTPADMHRAVLDWHEALINATKKGEENG